MPVGQEPERERRARPGSFAVAALSSLALVAIMSSVGHWPLSVPLGAALTLLASFALLDGFCFFDHGTPARTLSMRELARPLASLASSIFALVMALRGAVAGVLPYPVASSALLVTLTSLLCVGSLGWLADTLRRDVEEPPFWRREGAWLLAASVVLYVPMLGNYSLFDPWETHYGEVAREMIARDDWLSFWWAQENWFWSKPALDFWLQGLSFVLLGVHTEPDQMLASVADGRAPAPEWAARAPVILLTLIANYLAYKAVARVAGRRAGFLAGLVLTLTPYWFLIAHQSMTDMPYVAPLTAALSLVILGLDHAPSAHVSVLAMRVGRRQFRIAASHAIALLTTASALPQIAYLFSRNLSLSLRGAGRLFRLHTDEFMSGSGGGNCGLPGNDPCELTVPVTPELQPALLALVWGLALAAFLWLNKDERRAQRWCFIAAWYFVALSALGKGAPGLVLPLVITLVALMATKRFRDIERLEWASFGLIIATVTLPWYVQAFLRHGTGFTDRLLFYDMYKRAFVHVHDTNAGDDVSFRYYLWQLGYGLFPWTGLALWGFLRTFGDEDEARSKQAGLLAFLGLWCLLGFAMFSVSLTKFHHYALPVAPPAALLAGLALDRALGDDRAALGTRRHFVELASAFVCAASALLGALWITRGSVLGAPSAGPGTGGAALGAACLVVAVAAFFFSLRSSAALPTEPNARFESATIGLFALLAATLCVLIGQDLFNDGAVPGQARLINLFSYNYSRPFPTSLDFEPALCAVSLVSAVFLALMLLPRFRPVAGRAFIAACFCFGVFALDIYMVRVAPHWGQRETILTYYATRAGPEEPLVAYQLNWKGENFYTGNHLPAFVSSGQKFRDWVSEQRKNGTRVMYFTTEHSRLANLKNELGIIKSFQVLTKEDLNNKFFLARVEL